MKIAERDIQAVKINLYIRSFIVYIKQIRFISISGVEYFSRAYTCTKGIIFKLLRMLPFKLIFQSLDGKYCLLFLHVISSIYMQNRQFHSKWFLAAFSLMYLSGN